MQAKPYLTYYPAYGKGEMIRMILSRFDVEFQEGYSGHQREKYEFGQIPVLDIDGVRLTQSKSILDYLSKKYGLFPSKPELFIKVKFLADVYGEMRQAFKDYVVLSPDREHTVPLFYNKVAPQVFQILEDTLKQNEKSEYLVGEELTAADLLFCEFLLSTVKNENIRFGGYKLARAQLDKFPEVEAWVEKRKADFPRIQSRPPSPF